ncbi:ParB/RepB/Spo0J family partition protein [Sporosarcina sp. FSL K6-1508]|uniref:ParB/RepB/Spo0J family partition protein n=1 Tax=Sporosarcina sp. FSL K6-1508 TaxID=2921553 RepID=UPI0030F98B7A
MAKFSLTDLMSEQSKGAAETKQSPFKIEHIQLEKLYPSKMNKYIVEDIRELKSSIELTGLQQNLLVRPKGDGYEVLSGHRRLKAMVELYDEGNEQFKTAPCKITRAADDIQAELQLILANSTSRELTDYEKTYQAKRLYELLKELQDRGHEIKGRKREIVAQLMGVSTSQVARMESINNKLVPELKEEFKEGNVNITTAYEISRLPEEQQQEVVAEQEEGQPLTPTTAKEKRAEHDAKPIADIIVEKSNQGAEKMFEERFGSLVKQFASVLEALNDVGDPEKRTKYSKKMSDLVAKIEAALPKPEEMADKEFEERQVTIFDELTARK